MHAQHGMLGSSALGLLVGLLWVLGLDHVCAHHAMFLFRV